MTALFVSWQPSLLRYARRYCATPELAEDLVQEAFLALCRKSAQGEDILNPRRWTLRVVRHQASKHLRDRLRHREEWQSRDTIETFPDETTAIDTGTAADGLLQLLTPRERQVMQLRMREFKYEQIAGRLGISAKTVSVLLARARHKLQRAVHGAFGGTPPVATEARTLTASHP